MTVHCRYCCRGCRSHFTSLEAFDAHRAGPFDGERTCSFPDDADLVELPGACRLDDPDRPKVGVTIYSTARAARARDHFNGRNGRQAAPANVSEAVLA